MNTAIKELFLKSEGRYLNDVEASVLLGYSEGLLSSLDAMQTIERAEAAILDDVVRVVMGKHPAIAQNHGSKAELLVRRDQAMVLRYASFAMLLADPNFIYDKLAVWMRTIVFALVKTDHALDGAYALVEACRAHLPAGDAAAVTPYIQVLINEFEQNRGTPS